MTEHPAFLPPHTPAASQPAAPYVPTPDEAELLHCSREWMRIALEEKDETQLRRLMAPEFTLQVWDATRSAQNLDTWMHALQHRLSDIEFEYTSSTAQVFGDIGVLYSAFWWKGAMDGQPFTDCGFMADVWSRRSGAWQVVARRSASLQQIRQLPQT